MATRPANGFIDAFKQAYGEGREDWSRAYRATRKSQGLDENAPKMTEMTGAYPTGIRVMEALGKADPQAAQVREDLGIGRQTKGKGRRAGQLLGTLAADVTQDNTRNFYWLLNAAQAVANVGQEMALGKYAPQLFGSTVQRTDKGVPLTRKKNARLAQELGLLDANENPTRGVSFGEDGEIKKRNYEPGDVAALAIPTGLAVNTTLGLMSPFGGTSGYEAAIPSEEDPRKTANVIAEVGTKYFMGSTGSLLPYNEFKEDRPDVSKGEYKAYKAFKYDKDVDMNPFDDGQVTLPGRVIKATTDGIHGPEVQVLGRSIPLTTGILPLATTMAATTYGATRNKPIARGLQYGLGGYAVGTAAGAITEELRRRAGASSNDQLGAQ